MGLKFLKGLTEAYNKSKKQEDIFYYTTDNKKVYLGDIDLSVSAPKYVMITITSDSWTEDTGKYKVDIKSALINSNCVVNGYMDLDNQKKLVDGYTDSYDGGVYIYTSQKPSENIDISLCIQEAIQQEV